MWTDNPTIRRKILKQPLYNITSYGVYCLGKYEADEIIGCTHNREGTTGFGSIDWAETKLGRSLSQKEIPNVYLDRIGDSIFSRAKRAFDVGEKLICNYELYPFLFSKPERYKETAISHHVIDPDNAYEVGHDTNINELTNWTQYLA